MSFEFLASTEASWTYVDAISHFTRGIRTFDANGVGQIAHARVTFDL